MSVKKAGRAALQDFNLHILEGEFLFVYGFSDSGIRELGDVLSGALQPDTGRFYVQEKQRSAAELRYPGKLGIYIIQNLNNLVENLSIAENLFLGGSKKLFQITVSRKKQEIMAARLLRKFNLELQEGQKLVRQLPYYQQLILKMAMAYARGAKLVVFNDILGFQVPQKEQSELMHAVQVLLDDGISVLWLNQRMGQARRKADRIVLLEQGRNVCNLYREQQGMLDKLLRQLKPYAKESSSEDNVSARPVLRMDKIRTKELKDVSLEVYPGEIVCVTAEGLPPIADFRDVLCGTNQDYAGTMFLEEKPYFPTSYGSSVAEGVVYLDMMWYEKHCNPDMSIVDNLLLGDYWQRGKMFAVPNRVYLEHVKTIYRMRHPDWPADYWRNLTVDQQKTLLLEKLLHGKQKLVVITELFFQLNDYMTEQFASLLQEIRANNKAVILTAATDRDYRQISDRVIILNE